MYPAVYNVQWESAINEMNKRMTYSMFHGFFVSMLMK